MPTTPTPRLGLIAPAGTDAIATGDDQIRALITQLEAIVPRYGQGVIASRPTSTAGTPGIVGRFYYATDLGILFYDYGTGWAPQGIPLGGLIEWAGSGDLSAELVVCDGRALSRTTYAGLFARLGGVASPWGLPDGATFSIPDIRGRTTVSPDGTAGRLSTFPDSLGGTGGEERHVLTTNEQEAYLGIASGIHWAFATSAPGPDLKLLGQTPAQPHNNMQPYAVVNKVIRVI